MGGRRVRGLGGRLRRRAARLGAGRRGRCSRARSCCRRASSSITLAHVEAFDLGRLQAWAWLVLFAGFAATTGTLLVRAPRGRGPGPALPAAARVALAAVGAVALAASGVALWIDPAAFGLPALGGRFAGSWVAMLATFAGWAAAADRRAEARLPALALLALPAGALLAAARTGTVAPGHLAALGRGRRDRRGRARRPAATASPRA